MQESLMFDGVALSSLFESEGASRDVDLLREPLELLAGSSSFSLHFGPEFSCEIPSSVTLTVLLEGATPSVDAFVVAPFVSSIEPKPDTFFPAGKASVSAAEKAGLSEPALDAGATARAGTSVDRAWQETRLAIRERPGALAIRERPGPLRVPSEKYSPEWFHEQGWVDFQVPRQGEMIVWRGSQKGVEGYTWGLGERPSSLSEIEGRFGRLWQEGTPDTLYVGRLQPGSPAYIRLSPVSGELEINIRPQFVELIEEMALLPGG